MNSKISLADFRGFRRFYRPELGFARICCLAILSLYEDYSFQVLLTLLIIRINTFDDYWFNK